MKTFEASTIIARAPGAIWPILVDTSKWPEWDPSCERIDGAVAAGARLEAFSKLSPGRGFGVRVTELVPETKMVWTGGMPLGLFKGERTYTLEAEGAGTRVTVREVFTGPMLGLIGKSLPDMAPAFRGFVEGLKRRAEGV